MDNLDPLVTLGIQRQKKTNTQEKKEAKQSKTQQNTKKMNNTTYTKPGVNTEVLEGFSSSCFL